MITLDLSPETDPEQIEFFEDEPFYGDDDNLSDVEADAMTLVSAGMGTDEDYGFYGNGE